MSWKVSCLLSDTVLVTVVLKMGEERVAVSERLLGRAIHAVASWKMQQTVRRPDALDLLQRVHKDF